MVKNDYNKIKNKQNGRNKKQIYRFVILTL